MGHYMPKLDCTRPKIPHRSMVVGNEDSQFDALDAEAVAANRRMYKRF